MSLAMSSVLLALVATTIRTAGAYPLRKSSRRWPGIKIEDRHPSGSASPLFEQEPELRQCEIQLRHCREMLPEIPSVSVTIASI